MQDPLYEVSEEPTQPWWVTPVVVAFIFGPPVAGTLAYWYTENPAWLCTWVWALILGLAG